MARIAYGLPYMGSKRRIAPKILDYICAQNPNAKYFYDLFGGGGAISFEALQRKQFERVIYNELNAGVVALLEKIRSEGVTQEFYQWISREKFNAHKADSDWFGGLCKVIWSFGNVQKSYLFGKEIEQYKKQYHELVVFGTDHTNTMSEFCMDYVNRKYKVEQNLRLNIPKWHDFQERRLDIRKQLAVFEKNCKAKQLRMLQQLQQLERLERLQQLEQLQQLERLDISCGSYSNVLIDTPPHEAVIYLDPPYEGTGTYAEKLSHREFEEWVKNHDYKIYVSGYKSDLPCVFELNHTSSLSPKGVNKTVERLFCNKPENNLYGLF